MERGIIRRFVKKKLNGCLIIDYLAREEINKPSCCEKSFIPKL
jgi:hypothetical protein